MIRAYNEWYLNDAMQNLGDMMDYAVCDCGFGADEFFQLFIASGIASRFERGNPKYIVGMSGVELAKAVMSAVNVSWRAAEATFPDGKSVEYWTGWIMAYYQWSEDKRFEDMVECGLPPTKVMSMYILHEADEQKFVDAANAVIAEYRQRSRSKLQQIRKSRNMTQRELSHAAGVSLRMVQLYEQRQDDIGRAQVNTIIRLAKVLGCSIEDIIE